MRSLIPIAIFAILLAAPIGVAQLPPVAPPTPVFTIVIQGAPAAFTGLEGANATSLAAFQIVVTLSNVVCTETTTIPITVTADAAGAPSYFSARPEPDALTVTVAQGPHGSPPVGSPGGGTVDGGVRANITGNITTNASVAVTVTASAPAPAGCQGAGAVPAATSEPVTIFANMTAPPAPPAEEPPAEDTPFVGVLAVAAVAVAVAFARRRKP